MHQELKPKKFKDFFGQKKIKQVLNVLITSSKKRKKAIDHILFYGAPGFGKTTLANIIANETESKIHFAQGPLIDKKSDVLSLFGSLKKNDIIFIDEIHGINKNVEELLYSALEEGVVDVTIGPEGDQKIIRMKLPPFTAIGATTKIGKISNPLRDRFPIKAKLEKYDDEQISQIINKSFKFHKYEVDNQLIKKIVPYTSHTPRIAKNLIERIIDYATYEDNKDISEKIIIETFTSLGMYKLGLNDLHLSYLKCLGENFEEKFVSLETISSLISEEKGAIETIIEPILLEKKLIEKSSRGRRITNEGINYLTTFNLNNHL